MSSDTRKQSKGIRDPCCRRRCQVLRKSTVEKPTEYKLRKLGEHRAVKLREEQALFLGGTCRKQGMSQWQGSGKGEHGKIGRVRSNHGKCFSIQQQMCGYYASQSLHSQPVFPRVFSFPVCSHSLPTLSVSSSVGVILSGHGSWILQPSSPAPNYLSCLFISPSPPHPFLCPPQHLSMMGDHGSLVDMCVSFFLSVILLLTGLQRALCFYRASSWCP